MTVLFSVLFCMGPLASAQNPEMQLLRRRNAELQTQVDSLQRRLALIGEGADPWEGLSGLQGGVSSLDDAMTGRPALVLAASPSLNISYAPAVGKHVDRYVGRQRKMMIASLGRYARHYDYFRDVFSRYGVPEELTALCIVESAVTSGALSPAGAAGMWQLMPSTARGYGLVVDEGSDERYDVRKSTDAAARLLRDLHSSLGSWALAVMAYNCGAETVRRAIIRSGGSTDPWTVLALLPEETRSYLPAFLAASYLTVYGESEEGLVAR